ncbi:hypothetical protein FHL15_004183 [Xylaria flabelliformis]|uniref:Aminoglycoside phosphotransferase domain-containing protein n=1 Tax=Xylaria flabelliformis TaxID=2512241 RepID=A0A553I4G1_9PEZI|nr:hypothetical protein FHL15_004183 [Xylaria flabelliformis]
MTPRTNTNLEILAILVDFYDEEEGEYHVLVDVTYPLFEFLVIAKFIKFPWQAQYFEAETTTYKWVKGQGVGPKLLDHIMEAGRCIGFIVDNVDGARAAKVADLSACQSALAKLQSLGIVHGDINKHNFLKHNGKATLIDFESARKSSNEVQFESEFQRLENLSSDTSGRGGVRIPEEEGMPNATILLNG